MLLFSFEETKKTRNYLINPNRELELTKNTSISVSVFINYPFKLTNEKILLFFFCSLERNVTLKKNNILICKKKTKLRLDFLHVQKNKIK